MSSLFFDAVFNIQSCIIFIIYYVFCTVIIDQYTIQSTFTIQHVQIADEGLYLCTGHSSSLDKQASVTKSFTLNVMGKTML